LRTLHASVILFVLCVARTTTFGQYLHFHNNADGKPVLAIYQGESNWLVDQKDAKSHLQDLKELAALKLVQHEISEPEMRYVADLKQLRSLTIGDAPESVNISDRAFRVLSECHWLEDVWICKRHLKDSDLIVLQKLPKLKSVTIEGEDLCDADTSHGLTERAAPILASIKTLENLAIRGDAGFSDRSIEELTLLPRLESLEVASSRLTDKTLETVATKMKLRELWIRSSHFTDEGVKALKESVKIEKLTIERDGKR
jgi:hypothetical protein